MDLNTRPDHSLGTIPKASRLPAFMFHILRIAPWSTQFASMNCQRIWDSAAPARCDESSGGPDGFSWRTGETATFPRLTQLRAVDADAVATQVACDLSGMDERRRRADS